MVNFTISVPDGTTNHGNPRLICTPPNWYDYVLFYFANYFAHAATVVTRPGQGPWTTIAAVLAALVVPVSGVVRAVATIRRHACTEIDPLRRAASAGALCMVVSAGRLADIENKPEPRDIETRSRALQAGIKEELNAALYTCDSAGGQSEREWWDPPRAASIPLDSSVHGQFSLPAGYKLAPVPVNAPVSFKSAAGSDRATDFLLSSSYNIPKLLISLVQTLWAVVTLYRARGDQIETYGYAAFGLTVAPYAFMSIMNTIGNLVTPNYNAIFIIRTPLMDEAESRGGAFSSEIRVQLGSMSDSRKQEVISFSDMLLGLSLGLVPLAIIGLLSGFRPQSSTVPQRGLTMAWLSLGILSGALWSVVVFDDTDLWAAIVFGVLMLFLSGIPAIRGMVEVGNMINSFGVCTIH